MRPPAFHRHLPGLPRVMRLPLAVAVLLVLQVLALRHYEYSKAWLVRASIEEARAPRDPLALGELRWDPARYQQARSLAPLRAVVAEHCAGRSAIATAECLTSLFARRFPHGTPAREFFDADYAPAADLAEHLAGAPGHCVTRSALLAAAMLSAGFPARVVQLLPPSGRGHNVAEVWDAAHGWVYVDPTFQVTVDGLPGARSAASALGEPESHGWSKALRAMSGKLPDSTRRDSLAALMSGHLVYPDPWLYTRVGHRAAPAPFQGRFVIVGPPSFSLGVAQPLLHIGITLALLALAGSLVLPLAHLGRVPAVAPIDLSRPAARLPAHAAMVVRPGRDNDVDPPGSAVA